MPEIKAEFVLDVKGTPDAIAFGGRNHYRIRLFVEGAPADTHAVTYKLHETYADPLREVRDKEHRFEEEITSYGDYDIVARIRRRLGAELASSRLSDALRLSYGSEPSKTIASALKEIEQS